MSESTAPLLDIAAIEAIIPHRFPFLLVDRVLEIERLTRIRAAKAVTFNEPWFLGHFPGHPVMPGVLVVEALAQAGAILVLHALTAEERDGRVTYFMGIDSARFRKPVTPGCLLELRCEVTKSKGAIFKLHGTAWVEGQLVAEADIMAMLSSKGP
ncbi:MAG TPA: 3-hydroxyacyl-ACP dehydratase FabZ [Anaeromyxobacteraceae bacterium]|nr:3-hydroxyacyl-ACP dehydratase FabZ [Anaeromyxobacteraceae bacterium]